MSKQVVESVTKIIESHGNARYDQGLREGIRALDWVRLVLEENHKLVKPKTEQELVAFVTEQIFKLKLSLL